MLVTGSGKTGSRKRKPTPWLSSWGRKRSDPTDAVLPRRTTQTQKWIPPTLPRSVPSVSPQHFACRGIARQEQVGSLLLVGPASVEKSRCTNFEAGSTVDGAPILKQDQRWRACLHEPARSEKPHSESGESYPYAQGMQRQPMPQKIWYGGYQGHTLL